MRRHPALAALQVEPIGSQTSPFNDHLVHIASCFLTITPTLRIWILFVSITNYPIKTFGDRFGTVCLPIMSKQRNRHRDLDIPSKAIYSQSAVRQKYVQRVTKHHGFVQDVTTVSFSHCPYTRPSVNAESAYQRPFILPSPDSGLSCASFHLSL